MLEVLLLLLVVGAVLAAHVGTRRFVRRRLRYVRFIDRPAGIGLAAGVATLLLALPVTALLPPVGAGTALLLGAGAGSGAVFGARDARVPKTGPAV